MKRRARVGAETVWDAIAWMSRYGHQSAAELLAMDWREVQALHDALSRLAKIEFSPKQ